MSLLYIVDGYNVINRSSLFKNKSLKEARNNFFSYLEHDRPHGSFRNRLIIVFDGSPEVFGCRPNYDFEIQFTTGETADEKIKEIVSSSPHSKNIVVVTDDKDLGLSIRSYGAKNMSTEEFLNKKSRQKMDRKASLNKEQGCGDKAELNIVQKEKITQELSKIWLKKRSC